MEYITRRYLLKSGAVGVFGFLTGCLDSVQQQSTTNQDLSPRDFLPVEKDGWTLKDTESGTMSHLGGKDSIRGYYKSPNNENYEVVIMEVREEYGFGTKAKNWKCDAGWTVALGYKEFVIAAGTGTVQRTFTPEAPPQMDRTPIPETNEMTKELLSNSPPLSREIIDNHEVTDEDCRR